MKKIIPYKTLKGAISALDNGGRFYNLLTRANDGEIEAAELAKVAGVLSDKQRMVLYLEMSLSGLDPSGRKSILQSLSPGLKKSYDKYKPNYYSPGEARARGILSSNAIIEGVPRFTKSNTDFSGFIMFPMMVGKTMTMMMIPIFDQYDVYRLFDEENSREFIIAHARGSGRLPDQKIRCGGILKELKPDEAGRGKSSLFLETFYYVPLN